MTERAKIRQPRYMIPILFKTDEYSGIGNFHNGAALAFKSDESGISSVLVDKTGTVVYEFSDAAYIEPISGSSALCYRIDAQGNSMLSVFDYETQTFSEDLEADTAVPIGSGYFVIGTLEGMLDSDGFSCRLYNEEAEPVCDLEEFDGPYINYEESFAYVRNGNLFYIIADMPQKSDTVTDYENYEETPVREYDTVVFKAGDNRANVRGEMKLIDSQNADVRTFIKDGRIMLPVRFAAYTLPGCNVYWDDEAKTVTISGDKRIVMTVGSDEAEITEFDSGSNDYITRTAELDVPPLISEDRAFIPLRFAAEITGGGVFWDEEGFAFVGAENEEYKKQFEGALLDFADYPVIDGSTATIPLSEALTSRALGISPASASEITYHTKTSNSFSRLINREADLLLSGGLNEEKIAAAAEKGIELEAYAVAKEGFVFMLNKDNPVKNLTTSQIQNIYQGKITNWSELGGNDAEIIPFQRNEDSGSQSIMTRVVMNGLEMMPPKKETLIGAMGEIVDAVAEFDNSENSIGYSVYYYFSQMHNRGEVSLAAVDGVVVSNENIRNGSYPFVIDYCVMIRKDEPEDSPVRKLVDFLLSEEGAKLVADSGFVPVN